MRVYFSSNDGKRLIFVDEVDADEDAQTAIQVDADRRIRRAGVGDYVVFKGTWEEFEVETRMSVEVREKPSSPETPGPR